MAIMMASLYDALKAANVDDDMARRAAEEVANHDSRAKNVETRLDSLQAHVDSRFTLLQRMLAFNLALTTAILFKVFS